MIFRGSALKISSHQRTDATPPPRSPGTHGPLSIFVGHHGEAEIDLGDYVRRLVKYARPEPVSLVLLHVFMLRICKVL